MPQIFLREQKYISDGEKVFFDGKPKMTKKIAIEIFKIPKNTKIWQVFEKQF